MAIYAPRKGAIMKTSTWILPILASAILSGCDGAHRDDGSDVRVLASNVILGTASADEPNLDPDLVVRASNVVYEAQSDESSIQSANVQDALEEVSLRLPSILPGTWTIENKNHGSTHAPTGRITIRDDGTFDLEEGSFAAIGMGSGPIGDPNGYCDHDDNDQTYEFVHDRVVLFRFTYGDGDYTISGVPTPIEVTRDRILFLGSGGCGVLGEVRISILTRVEPAPGPP
jgi:hypothetical protein